jgi:hypothetical protein
VPLKNAMKFRGLPEDAAESMLAFAQNAGSLSK